MRHGKCVLEFSLILVAFDLEESASQGSQAFVQDFLLPTIINNTKAEVRGAIILDSVLHYNGTAGSQKVGKEWSRLVPGAVEDIAKHEDRGDFLALIHRNNVREEQVISDTLQKFWSRNVGTAPFRLVDFQLDLPGEVVSELSEDVP